MRARVLRRAACVAVCILVAWPTPAANTSDPVFLTWRAADVPGADFPGVAVAVEFLPLKPQ